MNYHIIRPAEIFCITLIAILFNIPRVYSERVRIEHYSVTDGLSENTVICMHQDRKGIVWFGTFAGLNRFDGYNFRSYKVNSEYKSGLSHNRVDLIEEDAFGFLWLLNYSGGVQRFDPRTEEFLNVPDFDTSLPRNSSPVIKIRCFASGEIWLITKNNGVYCVETDPVDYSLKIRHFGKETKKINTDIINDVYKDWQKNVWMLSDNGLVQLTAKNNSLNHFFEENIDNRSQVNQEFFCSLELDYSILFGSSNGRIWLYNKEAQSFELINTGLASSIVDIRRLANEVFIVLTSHDGFAIWDKKTNTKKCYNTKTCANMPSDEMISSYMDRRGDIWMQTSANGVLHYSPTNQKLDNFTVRTDNTSPYLLLPNFIIFEDKRNTLWVHPLGGGFSFYDRENNTLRPFYNEPGAADRRFSNLIHSAMADAQGNLWLCTYSKGIEKINFLRSDFSLIQPNEENRSGLYENEVRCVYQDPDGIYWVSTKDATLYLMDRSLRKLGYLGKDGRVTNSGEKFRGLIYSAYRDRSGRMWLGSKGLGLFCLKKTGSSPLSYTMTNYKYDKKDIYSLSNDNVYSIFQDNYNRIWIGTFGGGLNLLDENEGEIQFISSRNNLRSFPVSQCQKVRHIASDSINNLWVATTNGLVTFASDFRSPGLIEFSHIMPDAEDTESLSTYDIHYGYCTRDKEMFFATSGGGLNRLVRYDGAKPRFKNYSRQNGAPSDIIFNLIEDSRAKLWMSSANGLLNFNIAKEQFSVYDEGDGLECSDYSEASVLETADHRIAIGTNIGLYVFAPEKIIKNTFVPPLVFTDFQLFNKSVEINSPGSPLSQSIDYVDHIELNHHQSVFTIFFAALDMENTQRVEYAYRLRGLEKEWNITRGHPRVTYTNLPAKDYVFEVRSTNSDGVWVNNNRELKIRVRPSFWKSPVAYVLYAITMIVLLAIAFYIQYVFFHLKNKVAVEQKISNLKLRFFTDISHELRTPLTLIASPVEYLIKNEELSDSVRSQLQVVQRNVDRMLRLVNQILDFRKIQNDKMKLKIERISIGPFVSQVCENFMRMANDKAISFSIKDNSQGINIWADKDKVEKIIFNLLANAFKFTPSGKKIEVEVYRTDESASIRIQDEGVGMSREKLSHLFERFDSSLNYEGFQPGTGIGLSLTKELVDMHQATILADSQVGKGTWFTVSFRLGTKHFEGNVDFVVEDGENPELSPAAQLQPEEMDEAETVEKQSILIVEDNEDLRSFLRTVLEKEYRVLEAENGQIGAQQAFDNLPDIIVSDVMMPEIDGIRLTHLIKEDIRTSHTPVILLTAKTAMEDKLEALNSGADDYITKPFSAEYLEVRIKNLLAQRQKLQEIFRNSLEFQQQEEEGSKREIAPSAPVVASQDDMFIDTLIKLLEENMENSELTVDDLVSMAGLSRSVFFKKLKSLTGLAPIEFIREMRIKRAAQLIETRQYNISQVAYMVGMNDPRYFSRCFKQKYGMTPTEYKERNSQD